MKLRILAVQRRSSLDLASLATGKSGGIGPLTVVVWRCGPLMDAFGRGIFFAGTQVDASGYSSIHDGSEVKQYKIEVRNAYVTKGHWTLYPELFNGKRFNDAVWEADQASGFKSSQDATRKIEVKMAKKLKSLGYDSLIYTDPPAPAKTELAVLNLKSATIEELSKD